MPEPTPNPNQPAKRSNQPQGRRRAPKSRYGVQMAEKQGLKVVYGISEQQLRNYYKEAKKSTQETGKHLITLLEQRLDNAIFRAGLASTRPLARQMATHRLFAINGRPVDVPSYRLRKGDVVSVRENKRKKAHFSNFEKRLQNVHAPAWITLDGEKYSFIIQAEPTAEEANVGVDIQAIVEYFAR